MKNNIINTLDTLNYKELLKFISTKKAVIFDMDGTVLDSECLHFEAIERLTNKKSPYTQDDLHGMADPDVFKLISKYFDGTIDDFVSGKINLMQEIIPSGNLNKMLLPDMPKFLNEIKNRAQILALVTASERTTTHALLKHCNLFDLFDIIITRDDTKESKPSPMPYQHAINMLNINKNDAIVFEDSPTGIQAALSADIDTFKVTWYNNL